jgi:hypothetical protein
VPSGRWKRRDFEVRGRNRAAGAWRAAAERAEAAQRRRGDDPGRTKAMLELEPLDGGLCSRPEQSVERTGFVPEARQHPLYLENSR